MSDLTPVRLALAALQQNVNDMQENINRLSTYLDDVEKSETDEDHQVEIYRVHQSGLVIFHVMHDDCLSENWYTVDPDNANLDEDDDSGTMFDVRDIISAASHAQFSDHAAAIHYAVEAGWLTEDGLRLPDEGPNGPNLARRGQETNVSQT